MEIATIIGWVDIIFTVFMVLLIIDSGDWDKGTRLVTMIFLLLFLANALVIL